MWARPRAAWSSPSALRPERRELCTFIDPATKRIGPWNLDLRIAPDELLWFSESLEDSTALVNILNDGTLVIPQSPTKTTSSSQGKTSIRSVT